MTKPARPPTTNVTLGDRGDNNRHPDGGGFMRGMSTRRFVLTTARGLAPSLFLNIAGTLAVYAILRPYFPPSSIVPLLLASFVPLFGNVASLARRRRVDVFGSMMLVGLAVSIVSVLLGGGQRMLLVRESFATGVTGLTLLGSLAFSKPLGYYFAKQLLTANDPAKDSDFDALWRSSAFRRTMREGTILWGCLMLGEFALRVAMVLALPVAVVLAVSPLVFNAIIVGGIAVSAVWGRRVVRSVWGDGPR